MENKYTAGHIRVLSAAEHMRTCVFGKVTIDHPALIQGFVLKAPSVSLQEPEEDAPFSEVFFVNEEAQAHCFEQVCIRCLESAGLANDVKLSKQASGHFSLVSQNLGAYLKNAAYGKNSPFAEASRYFTEGHLLAHSEKFSYLLGHFLRSFRDGRFVLLEGWTNYILLDIIYSFSVSGENVETCAHFHTPGVLEIRLQPDSILLEMLEARKAAFLPAQS
ncbi:MAG: hypothetical protein IBJ09_05800 [Bacteroidia bacterium]|nr:hypothetical protein [Bacteroidia bacterium]